MKDRQTKKKKARQTDSANVMTKFPSGAKMDSLIPTIAFLSLTVILADFHALQCKLVI